jgi:hypothetical protein
MLWAYLALLIAWIASVASLRGRLAARDVPEPEPRAA